MEFPKYPKELVLKFNSIAESYFRKINQNNVQKSTLNNLRDSLLPKLMSGEVTVEI